MLDFFDQTSFVDVSYDFGNHSLPISSVLDRRELDRTYFNDVTIGSNKCEQLQFALGTVLMPDQPV